MLSGYINKIKITHRNVLFCGMLLMIVVCLVPCLATNHMNVFINLQLIRLNLMCIRYSENRVTWAKCYLDI